MATDERFVLVPYLGVNPSSSMVIENGLPSFDGSHKICSRLDDASWSVYPVYYCKTTDASYPYGLYLSQSNNHYMTVYSAAVSGGTNPTIKLTRTYTVGAASIIIDYPVSPYQDALNIDADITPFASKNDAAIAFMNMFPDDYVNISYVGNGCTLSGFPYVETGTGVIVPVTLPIGASLTADNISVTKNGALLDFTYNTQTQQIAFTAI